MEHYFARLQNAIRLYWDKPAVCNYRGETFTYGQLATQIERFHIFFEACGLKKGDRIAICAKNTARMAVSFLSVNTYETVVVPILSDFTPESVNHLVDHSESLMLFTDSDIWEKLDKSKMPLVKAVISVNDFTLLYADNDDVKKAYAAISETFASRYPMGFTGENVTYNTDNWDDLDIINYTSGTTSAPKGVMLTYKALSATIDFGQRYIPSSDKFTMVSMLPMAHMYGMMFEFLFEMTIGAHVHFLTRVPSPKIIMQAFADIKPHIIIAVPLIIEKVYKSKLKPILDRNKMIMNLPIIDKVIQKKILQELVNAFGGRFYEVIIGGAAFNPEVERFFHKIGFPFTVGYGMTECAPIIGYADWKDAKLYSCGKQVLNMEIRIDSPDPQNIPGEVLVKGANVFLGYYKNEEATKSVLGEDGWFHTGDMGVMDSDGYLFLKGRSKCMILGPSGQNIYPEEIEGVVNNVTYVVDSLVIEDHGTLVSLIYPDYHQAELDGLSKSQLEAKLLETLPEINKQIPNYAKISKMEFMPEDFERTPKRSIKRYLYQRN